MRKGEIKISNRGQELQADSKITPWFHTALINNPGSTFEIYMRHRTTCPYIQRVLV